MITVLICDSVADNRGLIRHLLAANATWTIVESDSPTEAFRILGEQDVAILLTDLDVPDVHGKTFIEALRSRFPNLPTVVISPRGADKAVVRALVLGAAAYVPRSALARDLSATIERLLTLAEPLPPWDQMRHHWSGTIVDFVIPSDRGCLRSVVQYLQSELSRHEVCGPENRTRIGMALSEAMANAIIHGNLEVPSSLRETDPLLFEQELVNRTTAFPYCDRSVHLNARFDAKGATLVITDEGSGFDVNNVPDPTDELAFNKSGNQVTMRVTAQGKGQNADG